MRLNLKLSHKALILVAVPLAFELLFVATLTYLLNRAEYEIRRAEHGKAVVAGANSILNGFIKSAMCLYMYRWTEQKAFKQQFEDASAAIPVELQSLKIMLRDSPDQKASLERLQDITNKTTTLLGQASVFTAGGENARAAHIVDIKEELEGTTAELATDMRSFIKDQESAEQLDPQAEARSRLMVQQCLAVGVAFNIMLAISLAVFFNRATTRRLQVLMDNTLHLARGEPLNVPVVGADEIAHLDKTFHDMAEALAEAARRKQELVAMVSHDLRTPLTSVQAALTLLEAGVYGELSDKARKEVTVAESNTTRLINLINDLLDIEKMEAGKLAMNCQNIPLAPVLEKSFEAVMAFADQHKVEMDVPGTDLQVYGDSDRLVQVLVNLLSNAIKFSPPNSTVTITVEATSGWVTVKVIDHGRGIPAGFRKAIFERFQQVEPGDASEKKGTGLGLPICKAIIEGHGGLIGVESEEGKGSTFWFRLRSAVQSAPESGKPGLE